MVLEFVCVATTNSRENQLFLKFIVFSLKSAFTTIFLSVVDVSAWIREALRSPSNKTAGKISYNDRLKSFKN